MLRKILFMALFSFCAIAAQGQVWTNIGDVDGSALGISTLSASQTWICTSSGRIYFYNGATLSQQTNLAQGVTLSLQDIYALDARHVWAAGYTYSPSPANGRIYFYNGTNWALNRALTNAGEATSLYDIYAASTSRVWACGNSSQIWATTNGGTTWTAQYTNADNKTMFSIDGIDATHVWAAGMDYVGHQAQILFFNGSSWVTNYSAALGNAPFYSIEAVATNDVWAIGGTNGTVVRFRNSTWESVPALNSTNANAYSISRTAYGDTWASAYGYGLFTFDGTWWTRETNMTIYAWRSDASAWYVFMEDAIFGLYVQRIYPALDRIESGIGFSWNSVPGRTYRIEWTDVPLSNNWRAADQITAGGWTTYWGDIGDGTTNRPRPTNSAERLYRVVQP